MLYVLIRTCTRMTTWSLLLVCLSTPLLDSSTFAVAVSFFSGNHAHVSRRISRTWSKAATVRVDGTVSDTLLAERLGTETNSTKRNMSPEDDPHPLRMQDWKLEMRVRPWKKRSQEVSFDRNGTLLTGEGNRGEWWFDVGGLYWDVNGTVGAAAVPTVFHHKAELHWNVFGSEPRMFRGTVTRDRTHKSFLPKWLFRPVVGSFVGEGVGEDTSDTSYAHRQKTGSSEDEVMPVRVPQQTDRY